ncbi:MAG: hypothetical protein LAO18_23825, partial [Acidobacteriia bacterium]|nr:hypothetical protein [Terriglobia bacterium]
MYSIVWLAFCACIACLALTPLCRTAFRRWEMVDRPDRTRKLHPNAVPRVGGIPIVLSFAIALATLAILPLRGGA